MIFQSFKKIFKHPVLLLPDILLTIFIALMARLTIFWTGVQTILPETGSVSEELIRTFFQENAFQIIWPLVLFFVTTFVVGVGEKVLKLELITNLLKTGKPHLKSAMKHRFDYFFKVILMKVYIFVLVFLVLFILIGLLGFLLNLLITPFNYNPSNIIAILTTILTVIALVLLHMGLIFRYPIMFMTKTKTPHKVIIHSLKSFNIHRNYTLTVWITIVIISIIFGIISLSISAISFILIPYLVILIGALHQTWMDLFVFLKFKQKFLRNP